ncbi:hypothetical protein PUN28_005515 [Cardiocondyla obscurior]|uniref:Uncharacterized protein n=1 Tax=Cardiocondyla obscurior TaxID=286306 RepID=A0AAW2GKB1_9HYME
MDEALRKNATDSRERARTNIQEERKNENRREIRILNKQDERGKLLAFRPDLSSPFLSLPTLSETPSHRTTSSPHPYASTSPTMAQPPTYPAHRPTIPHSNTPTDRSIPTNYQTAPRLSFYPTTLNGPEN